ncbi:MAG: erythromycin esterase family protein [Gammaproteobacteria bacterium]|nr:MAG: erythromycin esterase family protein [Gammaproteobacteria bacterium]
MRWQGNDTNANEALSSFSRFPLWMWRNTVILEFVEWLRHHNEGLPAQHQVGFYGLDMYSMYESIAAVLEYLDQVDPDAAKKARENYSCLDHTDNAQLYGFGVKVNQRPSCENEVVEQLIALRNKSLVYSKPGDKISEDDQFQAEQNALLIKSAESYYRQMFNNRANVWNLRDTHMIETLDNLHNHLSSRSKKSGQVKIAVWEHNSHLGDARATYMRNAAQHNVGQLARERYSDDYVLIGFTTYNGTVTAASEWDGPAERKKIRPALAGSIEDIFHKTELQNFYLRLTGLANKKIQSLFDEKKELRAIGVIYRPETERASHYFSCQLANQFDAIIHYDETYALEPLDSTSEWTHGEESTFPFGT